MKLYKCFAMQANAIVLFVVVLVLSLIAVYRNTYVFMTGFLAIVSLLVLAKIIDGETDALVLSEYKLKQALFRQLQKHRKNQDAILNMLEDLRESEEHLKKAYVELKDIDRIKTNILSNVSHELKTPITIVTGVLDLCMDETETEVRNELLKRGKMAIRRQNKVVENLIEASKVMKRTYGFKFTSFDISDAVLLSVREIEPDAERNDVKIKTLVPENISKVRGDFSAIKRVLDNLLDNAIKFNGGKREVVISAKNRGDFVEVSVKDTGIGVPTKHVPKIFDRLYQVDSDSTRVYSGTGMGLSVVKDIIKAHSGEIRIESKKGEGSIFYFTLPISKT